LVSTDEVARKRGADAALALDEPLAPQLAAEPSRADVVIVLALHESATGTSRHFRCPAAIRLLSGVGRH
jgi:hypothetical protein